MVQELQCHTTVFSYDHKDDYNLHTSETDRAKKPGECQVFPPPSSPFLASPMAFHHLVSTRRGPLEVRGQSWALLCERHT